jgi:bisphosphoglycerate-independent phosphoglycerate mutase (AlkP superfamily)
LRSGGRLCDIATTLLPILGLPQTGSMNGIDLFA